MKYLEPWQLFCDQGTSLRMGSQQIQDGGTEQSSHQTTHGVTHLQIILRIDTVSCNRYLQLNIP